MRRAIAQQSTVQQHHSLKSPISPFSKGGLRGIVAALLLCCAVALILLVGCAEDSDDEQGQKEPSVEKVAILYEGEFGGTWCIDELKLTVDGDTVVKGWFESESFPPKDWKVFGLNVAPQSWFKGGENIYITSMHEGKWCAQIQSGYSHQKEFLVLPEFEKGFLSKAKKIKLSFYVIGNVSLCNYACTKVMVFLPDHDDWAQAYSLDAHEFGLKDYEWRKVELDLSNPEQFYVEEPEE